MAEYTYDEEGFNFYYFLLSILFLSLAPTTFYSLYSGWKQSKSSSKKICQCRSCDLGRKKKKAAQSGKTALKLLITPKFVFLFLGWVAVAFLTYQVSFAEAPKAKWDPYDILGINEGATLPEIKKVYKKLSLIYHPDKAQAGTEKESEDRFIQISKAYQVLTDEDVRKNYEQYGHPDGKQSFTMGVALPRKLVEGNNSKFVLAFYGLVFGLGLPYYIARWWHDSRRRNKDKILHNTMRVFVKGLNEDDEFDDLVTLLAGAHEFKEGADLREGEESKLKKIGASISNAWKNMNGQRYKSLDDSYPGYRRKAAILLFAYFYRIDLQDEGLLQDQHYIIEKSVEILPGMLQIAILRSWLNTTTFIMDLYQRLMQATYPGEPSILQLPHIESKHLDQHNSSKKKDIHTVQALLDLSEKDRKEFLKTLSSDEALDVMEVAGRIPKLSVQKATFKQIGDKIVTEGSYITFVLKLKNEQAAEVEVKQAGEKESTDADSKDKAVVNDEEEDDSDDEDNVDAEKRQNASKSSLPLAHVPYYPGEKKPCWWIFLADPKVGKILVPPSKVTDIVDEKTVKIQFQAPPQKGTYSFSLYVKSDTYLDTDIFQDLTLNVQDSSDLPYEDPIDDTISEPDEDSIAGQMKLMQEQGLASALVSGSGQKNDKGKGAAKDHADSDSDSDSSDDD